MDDNASSNSLTPIACRLICYDQWLVTHVDAAWTIKDVKIWILGKCIPSLTASTSRPSTPMMPSRHPRPRPSSPIVFAPDPHHRPMSPITFAQPMDPNRKNEDSDDEGDRLGNMFGIETEEGVGDGEFPSGGRISGTGTKSQSNPRSDGSRSVPHHPHPHHRPSASYSSTAEFHDHAAPYNQYTLVRFSTGQLFEEDLTLSMYDIRPYEMLEVHRANVIVNLPRQLLREYIQPYWEGRIKALRVVWREDALPHAHRSNGDAHHRDKHHNKGEKGTRNRLEWRERWIVIRNGELLVFRDRRSQEPSQTLLFENLSSIHGSDHLKNVVSLSPEQRIICAKFRTPPKPSKIPQRRAQHSSKQTDSASTSAPSTAQYTTTTVISAGTPSKTSTKKKLQIRSSFPSSSSLRSNGKPSSSKGLSESSSKSNLNNMFTMSGWKQKRDKGKGKDKDRIEADPTDDSVTPRDTRDKGKGKAPANQPEDLFRPEHSNAPTDAGHDDNDKETILSSPVFARTSGSDDESDASEYGKGGAWRSKGGYGFRAGYRYVDQGSRGGAGEGELEHENMSGEGTGPGTGVESGAGEDDRDTPNEAGSYSFFDSTSADPRTADSSFTTATAGDNHRPSDSHTLDKSFRPTVASDRSNVSISRGSALASRSGEWIVMDVGDDHAFSSLLRIFHRLFPDPINSAFVSGLGTLATGSSTPLHSPSVSTSFIHNPSMQSAMSSQDSLIGSTHLSNRTAKTSRRGGRRRASVYSASTSLQMNTFGALPYPEWRLDIAVKAKKVGMGDVGRAMGWMLWGRRLTGEDESVKEERSVRSSLKSKGSKGRRKSRQPDEASLASRESRPGGSSSKKSVRSNKSTLTPTPSMKEPSDPYASDVSGGVSSDESQFGLDPSDESDGYSSEAEWQGWMADLHRQARLRQHQIELEKSQPVDDGDSRPSFPWISGGWYESPYLPLGATSAEIPQSQMQALRLYQEGRRALEPTATVISAGPPLSTQVQSQSQPPVPIPSRAQPNATVPPLSSPSSSESLAPSQRPRGMSFSPVDQPSSATPISAYSQYQYPLEPDKLGMVGSSPMAVASYVPSGTPTPKSMKFPAPPAVTSTSGPSASSPPREISGTHIVKTPPRSSPSDSHHAERRSSSAGLGGASAWHGDAHGTLNGGESPNRGMVKHDTLSLPTSFGKGHRPRLSVTTTGHAGATHGSPPATQLTSPHPLHAQSPTKNTTSTTKRILQRMRSGSSMRGATHDDS